MSKKKKGKPDKKSGKKKPDKKAQKKASKSSGKNTASKKASKPTKAKKTEKKIVKKSAPKKVKPSKTTKKAAKISKPGVTVKKQPKKAIVKKSAPTKKPIAKKVTIKKPIATASSKPAKKPLRDIGTVKALVAKKTVAGHDKKTPEKEIKITPVHAAFSSPKKENSAPVDKLKKSEDAGNRKSPLPDKKTSGVLAISNTIPVKQKNEISMSKIASISHSITNPIKKTDSYAVKPEKEPNGKFEMEFVVHSSAEMLYEFLSTPSGLSEWFCDDLNIRNGIYTFIWDDQLQQARLLKTIELQVVRFQWVDKTDGSYFEFRIQRDDLTNDIALIITDFAETSAERESSKLLWHSQIEKLMHVIGSIF